ncbi:dienelactone hydrolase family protein [Clostridium bowmanii]|uniref:alpha/beta hydrolase n=1 Tax=Clostridium bowmanii TaxID=132925 RepID=UPI001CD26D0A|nr:dienelactone hydrolase family protein [Clostridium bowmanii]MCA1075870.1 dienelactone hydrolase family protein [Clostridium bowmanii]
MTVLFTTVLVLIGDFKRIKIVKYLPILGFVTFIFHLFIEGERWQLYPLYLVLIIYFILSILQFTGVFNVNKLNSHKRIKGLITGLMILFLIISTILALAFPVYKMSIPKGKYKIGTVSFDVTDENRKAIYSNNLENNRKIKFQVWYPAENTKGFKQVPWLQDGDIVAKGVSKLMGFPNFILSHTSLVMSNSYASVPISKREGKYPVVIISHGWTGFRNLHTDVAELLASEGYIVVSIDHTYGSAVTVFNDGEVAYLSNKALPKREITPDFFNYANTLVNTFAGDIKLTLDTLEKYNLGDEDSMFKGKFDLTKVGLLGHSTGGGAVVTTALQDKRIKAVIGMDAWVEPSKEDDIKSGLNVPALFLRSEEWEKSLNNKKLSLLLDSSKNVRELYQINGIKHMDFSMVYMYSPLSKYFKITGKLDGRIASEIQQEFILNFYEKYLHNNSNGNTLEVSKKYDEVKKIY